MPAGLPGGGVSPTIRTAKATPSTSGPTTGVASYSTLAEMDVTITGLTVGRTLRATFHGTSYHGTANVTTLWGLSLDNAAEVGVRWISSPGSNSYFETVLVETWVITTTSHNVKARWAVSSGTLNGQSIQRSLLLEELLTA